MNKRMEGREGERERGEERESQSQKVGGVIKNKEGSKVCGEEGRKAGSQEQE